MHVLLLTVTLLQPPTACVDPASPLRDLVRVAALPATIDGRANEYVAKALETGTRVDVWRAVKRLEDVQRRRHDDVAVHLAYGLMHSISPDIMPEGSEGYRHRRVYNSTNAEAFIFRYLKRAAELDPKQWLAGATLARVALGIREDALMATAQSVVRAQLAADSSNAALRIALADLLVAEAKPGEARALVSGLEGGGCSAARAVIAEAGVLLGDSTRAATAYLQALATAGPDALHRFYDDARVVMTTRERAEYNALAAAKRAQWLREYWDRSAAFSGRDIEERIIEHVRRMDAAHRMYRLPRSKDQGGRPGDNMRIEQAYFDNDVPWDARGATFIRHGTPDRVVETKAGAPMYLPFNLTWVYFGEDPPRMVHFVQGKLGDAIGWHLAGTTFTAGCGKSPTPPAMGARPAALPRPVTGTNITGRRVRTPPAETLQGAGGGAIAGDIRQLEFAADFYRDRAVYDPRYAAIAAGCRGNADDDMLKMITTDMDRDYRNDVSTLLRSETANRRFENTLRMSVAGYQFRDSGGRPEVAAIAWVNLDDASKGGSLSALKLRFALVDSTASPLRFDTAVAVPSQAVGTGAVMRIAKTWQGVGLSSPRLRVFAQDQGDATRGGDVGVRLSLRDDAATHISDIVIGESEAGGPLVRGRARIAPLPSHTLGPGVPFRLFFEVYEARQGEVLETTIHIKRTDNDGVRELLRFFKGKETDRTIRLNEEASLDARGAAVRDVSVGGDLLPGEYSVTVTVKGSFGTATRATRLRVIALPTG